MKRVCAGYWGIECEDGRCPIENSAEYIKNGKTPVRTCEECPYYKGCDSCIEELCFGKEKPMAKNNIRSIRFSDDLAELIEQQVGNTFTEKFENLITRCVWELPEKERQLQKIQKEIDQEKEQLQNLKALYNKQDRIYGEIQSKITSLLLTINRANEELS